MHAVALVLHNKAAQSFRNLWRVVMTLRNPQGRKKGYRDS